MFCLMEQSRHLLKSGRMMQTGIKLLSTRANPDSNTMLKDPVRQVFISQSNDVFTNLALEDWLYKNHDFDHKVRGLLVFIHLALEGVFDYFFDISLAKLGQIKTNHTDPFFFRRARQSAQLI